MNIDDYATVVFDCDGVILDSNTVKTQAFYDAVSQYGENEAQALVDYHVANGGVSRYVKLEYFFTHILQRKDYKADLAVALDNYAQCVQRGLAKCLIVPGLSDLRKRSSATWMVASGGDQSELRELFKLRGIDDFFDGGIFGSPDPKDQIVERALASGSIDKPCLFIGDSRFDHFVAEKFSLDFLFVYGWSEFSDWKEYFQENNVTAVRRHINELLE